MKQLLNEWKKYIAEGKNTPPTPLPSGRKWDGKSPFAYNDSKGMHFFTPGIGWQTMGNPEPVKTSIPVVKQTSQEKLYPIDMATAKRYDTIFKVFNNLERETDDIMYRCSDVLSNGPEDKKRECDQSLINIKKQRKELFQMLVKPEEKEILSHYIKNRDDYISNLLSKK